MPPGPTLTQEEYQEVLSELDLPWGHYPDADKVIQRFPQLSYEACVSIYSARAIIRAKKRKPLHDRNAREYARVYMQARARARTAFGQGTKPEAGIKHACFTLAGAARDTGAGQRKRHAAE